MSKKINAQVEEKKFTKVERDGKWGFVNEASQELCKIKYDYVEDFCNGFAIVQLDGKYTFINDKGEEICEPIFDTVGCFMPSGKAAVQLGKCFGLIDIEGNLYYTYIGLIN